VDLLWQKQRGRLLRFEVAQTFSRSLELLSQLFVFLFEFFCLVLQRLHRELALLGLLLEPFSLGDSCVALLDNLFK